MSSGTSAPAPPVVHPGSGNNIIVNPRQVSLVVFWHSCLLSHKFQRLNPILNFIRNVGTEYGDIPGDFQVGRTTGVLYLR